MRHIGVFSFMFANGMSEHSAAVSEASDELGGASPTGADSSDTGPTADDKVASLTVGDTVDCKLACAADCEASPALLCRPGLRPWSAKTAGLG